MEGPLDFHPPLDGFRFVDVIGRGSFGLVKLARHLASGKYVAVKILLQDASPSSPLSAQGEAAILRSLRHKNIVRLLAERHTRTHLFLVMELATKGSLQSYVFEQGGLGEAEARSLFGQALAAVSYCHGQRVAHRDLKLGNLLLDAHLNLKLADFGLSLRLEQGALVRGFWGTPEYCAPELFLGEAYDPFKADVWSLGVVLFAMLAAKLPFRGKDTEELQDTVLCGCYVLPRAVSPALQELLAWLLTVDASGRPSAEDAGTHWWFGPGQDGTGTEGTPGPQPCSPEALPESSQGEERRSIEKDGLSLVSVSCDSMSVDISSARRDSSEASSQPQQQWNRASSAAPDSSQASSQPQQQWNRASSAAPDSSQASSQPQQQWNRASSAAPDSSQASSQPQQQWSPASSAAPDSSQASSQPQQQWSPAPGAAPQPASKASPSSPSTQSLIDLPEPEAAAAAHEPEDSGTAATADTTDTKASAQGKRQGRCGVGRRILRFLLRACCILPSRGSSPGLRGSRVVPK
ncbi:MAP/microtubule affinity-regulating kinase 3-like [Lepus europaeus]|uniref:MAP/microtubule affinity-regulating kinase 3-like n=1 Tax=Lepus europaeus TaxID=9983 RepID=UPI002B471DBE|nr:MAP/microtubule affinity-regulating kinase 3-like [Lepus europaeus]